MPYLNPAGTVERMTVELSDSRLCNHIAEGVGDILKGVRSAGLLRGLALGDAGDTLSQELSLIHI